MAFKLDTFFNSKKIVASCAALLFCGVCSTATADQAVMARKADSSLLLDITKAGSHLVVVGERGHVLLSDDLGQTWSQQAAPLTSMLTAVDFINENQGWAVAHDGHVIASADGGKTWTLVREGLKAQAELNEVAVKENKALLNSIQTAIDQGQTIESLSLSEAFADMSLEEALDEAQWMYESASEKMNAAVIPPPLMDVWFANENTGFAVGAFGSLLKTADGGKTWQDLSKKVGNTNGYHLNAVTGTADGAVFVGGEAGFLSYSSDMGETWQVADLGYDGSIFTFIKTYDGSRVFATGLRGNTFVSFDKGASWERVPSNVDYSLSAGTLFDGNNVLLSGSGGTTAVSVDGGQTFVKHVLPSRSSISAVVPVSKTQFIMVGQGGIHRFSIPQEQE